MTVVTRFVQAVSHGGLMAHPTLIVIHSAETPLKAGYAASIAENWFGKAATTSAHAMVDPAETIRLLSDNVVSYAVGPKANGFTLNIEQAGYAAFTRAQWTTTDGRLQIFRVGALVREFAETHGIPLRWATDAQILAAAKGTPGGVCYHDDIHRVLGGTTHTDPVPNYPGDLLEQAWGGKAPSVEDDMTPEQAQTLDKILYAITDLIKPQTDRITAVQSDVAEVHWGLLDPAQGLRVMVAGLLGKEASGVTAADIAGLIPNGIAADVADELQRRLTA